MVKIKLKKKALLGIVLLFLIIAAVVIVLLVTKKPDISKEIVGSWSTPGGTIYTFNKDNTGEMKVPLNKYPFTYKFVEEKLIIDFKDESAFDPIYEYSIEENVLTLKGENGTFTFDKVIKKNKK